MRGITHILNDKFDIYETYLYIAYIEDRIRMPEKMYVLIRNDRERK